MEMEMNKVPLISVCNAPGCAWRAAYLYRRATNAHGEHYSHQLARIVLDPTSSRPSLSGDLFGLRFDFAIPFMRWQANQPKIQKKWRNFIHSLDGRIKKK